MDPVTFTITPFQAAQLSKLEAAIESLGAQRNAVFQAVVAGHVDPDAHTGWAAEINGNVVTLHPPR